MGDNYNKFIDDSENSYKKGLDFQRELFKDAKHRNDYDSMCDAIENIKSEIKIKLRNKNRLAVVKRIEDIVSWYRNKESQYIVNSEEGKVVSFPSNMHVKVNHNLTIAYELLIGELELLQLI